MSSARIALGRTGGSLPTQALLDFRLAHARARDAVLSPFDPEALAARLRPIAAPEPVLVVESAAHDRAEYLRRPDLGRKLAPHSRAMLVDVEAHTRTAAGHRDQAPDLALVLSDGLSTHAIQTQAEPVLRRLLPLIKDSGWTLAPLVVALHGRVALQDEVGEIFRARISLMLLGERPGLGSADSLGAYFTFHPAIGRTDADRNCISNIRAGGLTPPAAARKIHHLLAESFRLSLSGVQLKDDMPALPLEKTPLE